MNIVASDEQAAVRTVYVLFISACYALPVGLWRQRRRDVCCVHRTLCSSVCCTRVHVLACSVGRVPCSTHEITQ